MTITALSKYESDIFVTGGGSQIIGQVRINAAQLAITVEGADNVPPEGDVNYLDPIRVTGTRRYGITARHIVISRIVGTDAASEFRVYRKVVILTSAFFIDIISTLDPAIVYGGFDTWNLIGSSAERHRLNWG
jgi:hypothetical protein